MVFLFFLNFGDSFRRSAVPVQPLPRVYQLHHAFSWVFKPLYCRTFVLFVKHLFSLSNIHSICAVNPAKIKALRCSLLFCNRVNHCAILKYIKKSQLLAVQSRAFLCSGEHCTALGSAQYSASAHCLLL